MRVMTDEERDAITVTGGYGRTGAEWLSGLRATLETTAAGVEISPIITIRLDLQALTAVNFLALQVGRLADQLEKMNGPKAQD